MHRRLHPLTNVYFIIALVILLVNDFYLKHEFHNWMTGKLSDFAGLFVFAWFWTAVFPNYKKVIYLFTAVAFAYWKSPYAEPFILFFSENIFPISRVADATDLLALLTLPLAWFINVNDHTTIKFAPIPIAALTIFSFCATSVSKPRQIFERPEYVLFKKTPFDNKDNDTNRFIPYERDSFTVIAVSEIHIDRWPALDDDYHKSKILEDLDLRLLEASNYNQRRENDLSFFIPLRDSLTVHGNTSVTIDLDFVTDELNFSNTRLHGSYRRYSKTKELLIDGRYKNGIPDSIWTFVDNDKQVTRKHFVEGEVTKFEEDNNGTTITHDRSTRKDVIIKEYVISSILSVLLVLVAIKLFLNFRSSEGNFVSLSNFTKISQIILLPPLIFIAAKFLGETILENDSDIFALPLQWFFANIILALIFATIHFAIKPRRRYDIILYIVLFIIVIMWIDQVIYLRQISI